MNEAESSEVSRHQVLVYQCLQGGEWLTAIEVAARTGVAQRTARHHLLKLSKLGLIDTAEVFPGHRYRLNDKAAKRNGGYVKRLEAAAAVFGDIPKKLK